MESRLEFIKNAILGERVGAISRSSRHVVKRVLSEVGSVSNVVEYGAGDGVLTKELLKVLHPEGKMLVVELEEGFVEVLKKINDPRLIVVKGKMQDVAQNLNKYGFEKVDLVLSSIPFSLIEKKERNMVVENTFNSLKPDGKFIVFHQYSTLMSGYLKKYFYEIKVSFELRNIFPCFIMVAHK
ncbi:MAG: methyltransferase domain-containing protein [Parcubacteria group bacterium]